MTYENSVLCPGLMCSGVIKRCTCQTDSSHSFTFIGFELAFECFDFSSGYVPQRRPKRRARKIRCESTEMNEIACTVKIKQAFD